MTLSPLDEYPIHQAAISMRHVATSDRNFYDRSYFNLHPSTDELFVIMGMGQYANLGVQDAYILAADRDTHRVVRASRPLGLDRMDTAVGPIRIEVIEGLRKVRFVCEPGEVDGAPLAIACDVTWEGSVPVCEEPGHRMRQNERVTFDTMRFAQTGCWTGWVSVDGVRTEVTPDRWWGTRDRSWGVRPVGEREPEGIGATRPMEGFYWIYSPMQFDDCSIFLIRQDEPDGTPALRQATRVWADGRVEELGEATVELTLADDATRTVTAARWHLREPDGAPFTIDVEILLPTWVGVGTGYGFDEDWRHGMWHGTDLVVQDKRWDLTDPAVAGAMFGIRDAVSRFTWGDRTGHGLFEWMFLGRHDPSGW